jgi:squalene-hopene/tetraprenyl-beta-curcumene cyclase
MTVPDPARLERAYQKALAALLFERNVEGHWTGELSTSALSTATAVSALALVQKHAPGSSSHAALIGGGLSWLAGHQNGDGGWGDTVKSLSNISTTMLCRAAFHITGTAARYADSLRRADAWMQERHGKTPQEHAAAVRARYGKDRTFAVPILTTTALAGLTSWREVVPLPFELACFPQSWFRFLRLHVVSYALPALIAIGQAVYAHRPPWNPVTRLVRWLARGKSLRVLQAIQPSSGGFLEATPLTSFVTLSLASIGQAEHPVARKGVEFLARSVRADGSWPIDTNLATWVTTLAVNALAGAGDSSCCRKLEQLQEWLIGQQFTEPHSYTGADPGGWGWTDLPGSVPDADDTPGALMALGNLEMRAQERSSRTELGGKADCFINAKFLFPKAIAPWYTGGLRWLLNLQNRDGGWPTFCKGWGHLPFDRSGCDLTAHAIRALVTWQPRIHSDESQAALLAPTEKRFLTGVSCALIENAIEQGFNYLARQQRPDGSWLPLWFGNQHAPGDENPTYGTARVLAAYRDLDKMDTEPARRGARWLLSAQNTDGGWGGAAGVPSSMEETALAVEVLLDAGPEAKAAVNKGLAWLVEQVETGGLENPTPIGFYFAKLWYFEKLYPIIFAVAALGRARRKLSRHPELTHPEETPPRGNDRGDRG